MYAPPSGGLHGNTAYFGIEEDIARNFGPPRINLDLSERAPPHTAGGIIRTPHGFLNLEVGIVAGRKEEMATGYNNSENPSLGCEHLPGAWPLFSCPP